MGSTERQVEKELDKYDERAERIVDVEERLREARENDIQSGTVDETVTIDLTNSTVKAPVVGVEKKTNYGWRDKTVCQFTALVDGEEETFHVRWPDDTTNSSEKLVRICEWAGVELERIGDIETLPVVIDGFSSPRLFVPPRKRSREVDIVLPGGFNSSFTYVPFTDRVHRLFARLALPFVGTPFIRASSSGFKLSEINTTILAIILGAFFSLGLMLQSGGLTPFLLHPIDSFFAFLLLTAFGSMVGIVVMMLLFFELEELCPVDFEK